MSAYSPSEATKLIEDEMDEKIGSYSKYLETVPENEKNLFRSKLLSAKLMKEKLVAMTALAKAQSILAEMDVLIAETNLKTAVDKLDSFKKDFCDVTAHKSKTQRETEKLSSMESTKLETRPLRVISPANADKENLNIVTGEKKKIHESKAYQPRSQTPTNLKSNKRQHANSSGSKLQTVKKAKKTFSDTVKSSDSNKSTLQTMIMSPIQIKPTSTKSMPSLSVTKGVHTCSDWFEQIKRVSEPSRKNLESVAHRVTDDDENTVVLESLEHNTHKDAINLSNALQQIMSPKPNINVTQDTNITDLTQGPVATKIQFLFEDDPKKPKKKSRKTKVKSEAPETGDDVLIL